MINFLKRLISLSFYALFFLVPLVFTSDTSELFEFNKLWLTFGLTIIIITSWIVKMILEKRIRIQRTPLDIPIALFLLSQVLSTIMSMDVYTSIWGYYSRFNGGLLSLLSYILLYYAFVSNVSLTQALRYIYTSIVSGIVVALWGLPSHFGYDPTCFIFRGTFDVSCWTADFQPKVRIFSTLGQPDWLSAYLGALIPITLSLGIEAWEKAKTWLSTGLLATTLLFFLDFMYTRSRGGYIGLAAALLFFAIWFVWKKKLWENLSDLKQKVYLPLALIGIILITFVVGTGTPQIDKFLLPGIVQNMQTKHAPAPKVVEKAPVSTQELGGTDSGKIRLLVWSGAIKAWEHYPLFGTGVETFAYAYYLFMPAAHNLTSEFGYLYNKAHNEYLNYLATTGTVGLLTYLSMLGVFLWTSIKLLLDARGSKLGKEAKEKQLERSNLKQHASNSQFPVSTRHLLTAGFLAGYISILVSNFFGFSVVIINLFLFLFPGFVYISEKVLKAKTEIVLPKEEPSGGPSSFHWMLSGGLTLVALYMFYTLIVFWNADKAYALGQNLVNIQDYQNAYQPLIQSVQMRPGEPAFRDELSIDESVLAAAIATQDKTATQAAEQIAQQSIALSDQLTTNHTDVVTYWKSRTRIFYTLAQVNPQYYQQALDAILKAQELAPTDAKVAYNVGLLYGQTGDYQKAIEELKHTIALKSNYQEAYYALALYYHAIVVNKNGVTVNAENAQKAIYTLRYLLKTFGPNTQATEALKAWGAQ